MIRWTGFVIAHRKRIVAAWLVLFVLGGLAAANLGGLLSNRFSVPGSESERGLNLIRDRMGDRSDGSFTLVATGVDTAADRAAVVAATQRGARAVTGGKAGPLLPAARGVVYAQISTPLENQDASKVTPGVRAAIGHPAGIATYLSGYPAINHDTQKIFNRDLGRGESIGVPIALIVMAVMFGTLGGMFVPIVFAADDDPDDARPRLGLRPHDGHGDLRDEHRRADRPGDRGGLLDARRLPLPRGARARPTTSTTRSGRRWRRRGARRCSPA